MARDLVNPTVSVEGRHAGYRSSSAFQLPMQPKEYAAFGSVVTIGGSVANLCSVPRRTYDPGRFGSGSRTGIDFKGSHFEREIVLWGVRWYVAYPISDRQLEEMMEERGVEVDHSTLNRWALMYVPLLEQAFRCGSVGWVAVGEWTRPMCGPRVSGSICIERSTRQGTQSISC
jgi:hypothetical protein